MAKATKMTPDRLKSIKEEVLAQQEKENSIRIMVGMGTCGISAGARDVLEALQQELDEREDTDNIQIIPCGCAGMCTYEPIVEVIEPGKKRVTYVHVTPEMASEIMYKHIFGGDPVVKYTIDGEFKTLSEQNFYKKQKRVVLKNCGEINPEDISEYIAKDGYQGLAKAVLELKPEDIIDHPENPRLRQFLNFVSK